MKEVLNTGQCICEVCGRIIEGKVYHSDGKAVCFKHYNQFKRSGQFLIIIQELFMIRMRLLYMEILHML